MEKRNIPIPCLFGSALLAAAMGCSQPAEPVHESLGEFPDGPMVIEVGQRLEYESRRSFSSPGSEDADSTHHGEATVTVDSLTPFGSWPLAFRFSQVEIWVNADETQIDTTRWISWRIFDFDADTVATLLEIGRGLQGNVEEFAEPRTLIRFPIPDDNTFLASWQADWGQYDRSSWGRDDVEVDFDVDGGESVYGSYEAYRIDQQYRALGSSTAITREWWGPIGIVLIEMTAVSSVTTWELDRYTPAP